MLGKIIKGKTTGPRRVMLYGPHGIGKTTWAATAPNPIYIIFEDGANDVGPDRTPLLTELGKAHEFVSSLLTEEHDYQTVVIDTVDWLERLIWKQVAIDKQKKSIEEIGYQKGYVFACDKWRKVLESLDFLRLQRQMNIVLLSHCKIVKYTPPDDEPYDRYEPDLHRLASPLLQEWCDEVFFATYNVDLIQTDDGFQRKRTRPIGDLQRIVYTTERPTCLAKRRIKLPPEIEMSWQAYASAFNGSVKKGKTNG